MAGIQRLSSIDISGRSYVMSCEEDFDSIGGGGGGGTLYFPRDTGPAGGHVFYISDGGLHGLEAAPVAAEYSGKQWGFDGVSVPGCAGTAIGTGMQNTQDFIDAGGEADRACQLAYDLSYNGYTDWYLPSTVEIIVMFAELTVFGVGNFTNYFYWTSTEYTSTYAYGTNLGSVSSGGTLGWGGKTSTYYVRAIRAF